MDAAGVQIARPARAVARTWPIGLREGVRWGSRDLRPSSIQQRAAASSSTGRRQRGNSLHDAHHFPHNEVEEEIEREREGWAAELRKMIEDANHT